ARGWVVELNVVPVVAVAPDEAPASVVDAARDLAFAGAVEDVECARATAAREAGIDRAVRARDRSLAKGPAPEGLAGLEQRRLRHERPGHGLAGEAGGRDQERRDGNGCVDENQTHGRAPF